MPPTEIRNLGSLTMSQSVDLVPPKAFAICMAGKQLLISNSHACLISLSSYQYKNDDIFLEAKRRNLLKGLISAVDKQPIESTWAVKYLDNETKTEE